MGSQYGCDGASFVEINGSFSQLQFAVMVLVSHRSSVSLMHFIKRDLIINQKLLAGICI